MSDKSRISAHRQYTGSIISGPPVPKREKKSYIPPILKCLTPFKRALKNTSFQVAILKTSDNKLKNSHFQHHLTDLELLATWCTDGLCTFTAFFGFANSQVLNLQGVRELTP